MNKFFKIENKIVSLHKDCRICEKVKVCKFHAKMKELCESNEFYGMTQYLEWNNSLEAFEKHASCQFYKRTFAVPDDKTVDLTAHSDIIGDIIRIELRNRDYDYGSYQVKIPENKVILSKYQHEDVEVLITDLLKDYKYA